MPYRTKAILADDEPLLLRRLSLQLKELWPNLEIVGMARNGREAVEMFEETMPNVCFLDVHMPALSGIEAARFIGDRAHLVFVTAFDAYAIAAFEQSATDYLLKPVTQERLALTVSRLKQRIETQAERTDPEAIASALHDHLHREETADYLRWIRVSVGLQLRLVSTEEVDYIRAEDKYTLIAWRDECGSLHQGVIRTPVRELEQKLDPAQFCQVHRSVVVNLHSVSHVIREDHGAGVLHLKHRAETLPVSRSYMHLFRQM